ncbi:MAG: hypothetical protein ACOVOF_07535 [Chryseotalea sp.]|jgi:hypothetical protein
MIPFASIYRGLILVVCTCACSVKPAMQKTNEQTPIALATLTQKETTQILSESKEYLLVKEIPKVTDTYFLYWVFDLSDNQLVHKGSITKGNIVWQSNHVLLLTKLPEVMPTGKTPEDYQSLIDLKKEH